MALLKILLTLGVWKLTGPAWTMFSKLKASVGLEEVSVIIFSIMQKMITRIVKDPQILEIGKKSSRRLCHWMIYQEMCQLFIRAVQILLCWIMWGSLIQRLSYI